MSTFRSVASTTSGSASFTCAKPSGTVLADVLVAFQQQGVGSVGDLTTPSGWTLLTSVPDPNGGAAKVWWKVAGSSEPSTYSFTQNTGTSLVAIAAISSASITTPVVAQVSSTLSSVSSVPTPSVTPPDATSVVLRWAGSVTPIGAVTWSPPATHTELADLQFAGASTSGSLAFKALSSGAATGSQSFTPSPSVSGYIGLAVVVGSGPKFVGWGLRL